MSTAEKIVYGGAEDVSAPLNDSNFTLKPQNKGRCSLRVKLAVAFAVLVALGLGAAGLYYGMKKDKAAKKPGFSVKYSLSSNSTNAAISLATTTTNETSCNYLTSDAVVNPVPMPHQVIFCKDNTYCSGEYMIVSLYDY